jgi:hypothetical protein
MHSARKKMQGDNKSTKWLVQINEPSPLESPMWKNTTQPSYNFTLPYYQTTPTPPHPVIPPRTYSLHRTMILIKTTLCYPKTLYWKTVREKADCDILTKQYFPRAHTIERREYETGLIVVGADSS